MRLAPNCRKWLEQGKCLWCGNGLSYHRDGAHYKEHMRMYASGYYSTWSEKQQAIIDKHAEYVDTLAMQTRTQLIKIIKEGHYVSYLDRLQYGITEEDLEGH